MPHPGELTNVTAVPSGGPFAFAAGLCCRSGGALLLLAPPPAVAHEKWFHEAGNYELRWDLLWRPLPLALIAAVVLLTFLAAWLWRRRGRRGFLPSLEQLGSPPDRRLLLYGILPAFLGLHVSIPLLVSGIEGTLLTPNNALSVPWTYAFGVAQIAISLSLFYGLLTRWAGLLLAALWMGGVVLLGPERMLESSVYLGVAAFFFLCGRGPFSVDRLLTPRLEPSARLMAFGLPALRVGLGLSLIVVAFTEKLANIPLSLDFLAHYQVNFTSALGMPLSDETFTLCAGAVELLVGLWVLLNVFCREVVLIAWFPLNLTLTVFGWPELVDHLPLYAISALLLLWSDDQASRQLWVRGLREGPLPIVQDDSPDSERGAGETGPDADGHPGRSGGTATRQSSRPDYFRGPYLV